MPTAVIKEVKAPIQAFDATVDLLGLKSGGPGTKGALFEWAEATEYGFRVVSVFDTEENAKADVEAALEAAQKVAAAMGVTNMEAPVVTLHDVHAFYTANPT